MECFDKIIGLSRTECECLKAGIKSEDRESESGIFLDEVEGGLKISAIKKIDCQDFVDKARQARKRAIDMFIEQMIGLYSSPPYTRRFNRFNSRIGKINTLRPLNLPQFAGLRLRTNLIRGAHLTINKIGLLISQEADVTVMVYKGYRNDKDSLEHVKTIQNLPTLTNLPSINVLDTPLVLPLFDDQLRPIDYYFVYDTALYGQPRDNHASCSCGGQESVLKTYLDPKGVSSSTIDGLTGSGTMYANGIFLDGKIECGIKEMLCRLKEVDESNTIAHAIAYKAQEFLIEDILGTGEINRFSMLAKEHLWGKRNHFRKEFDDRVTWLSQIITIDKISDCFACNDNRIRLARIGG